MKIQVVDISSQYYDQSLDLRNEVLRKPLNLDIANDDIYDEDNHLHFVAIDSSKVVGVVVLVPNYKPGIGKLRQMATTEEVRGKGYGISLVNSLEVHAKALGMTSITLNARHYACGFYKKLGYRICSDVFQEVGMDHYSMDKKL